MVNSPRTITLALVARTSFVCRWHAMAMQVYAPARIAVVTAQPAPWARIAAAVVAASPLAG